MSSALRRAVRGKEGCRRPDKWVHSVRCADMERLGGQLHCGGSVREILGYQSGAAGSSRLVGCDDPGHWREFPQHKEGSPVTGPVWPVPGGLGSQIFMTFGT